MRRLFLRDCQPGDLLDDVFVFNNKQLAAASNGKPYIKAFVGDRSATLTARWWDASKEVFQNMPDGGFVHIQGRVENYQSNLQIIIQKAWPPEDGSYDPCDLVPTTQRDIPAMFAKLTARLRRIGNPHLKALIGAYLADEPLMADFQKAPAAVSFHHAFIGGLLEHTANTIDVADALVPFYPGLNGDLIVAGIFLHDLAKTWELNYDCAFSYSDGGQLVGHIVKSAMWVDDYRRRAEGQSHAEMPQPLIDVIQHVILSHHGEQPQFGSPKAPATPEALVVHVLENLDAKLQMMLAACRGAGAGVAGGASGTDGNWTEFMKAFGGKLFRPDVAPVDGQAAAAAPLHREPEPRAVTPPVQKSAPPVPAPAPASRPNPAPTSAPAPLRISNPLFESVASPRK